ncbi:MAG: hypothetical protein HFE63_00945 [Clostridiales bacterium]|nr:hypothetical protein [Clostridiales bacterium]
MKYFSALDQRREIENYKILRSLGIPTLDVIAIGESSILLEDIASETSQWRLGCESDLDNLSVARNLAEWYRVLHGRGRDYVKTYGRDMYDESDYFTLDGIEYVKYMTGTKDCPVWRELEAQFDDISYELKAFERTLTYNDFYYTNFAVKRSGDNAGALMFDYNLLGKGYVYSDIRNVVSSLSKRAGEEFISCYGGFDECERAVDEIVGQLVTMVFACRYKEEYGSFPAWSNNALDLLFNIIMNWNKRK